MLPMSLFALYSVGLVAIFGESCGGLSSRLQKWTEKRSMGASLFLSLEKEMGLGLAYSSVMVEEALRGAFEQEGLKRQNQESVTEERSEAFCLLLGQLVQAEKAMELILADWLEEMDWIHEEQ